MEWNPQTLQFLSQSFLDTLSPTPESRRRAEKNLSNMADSPNYGLAVLRLVAEPSIDEQIRQYAAVNFKNHIKTRWAPSSSTPILDGEKEQIKTQIVPLMLSATPKIQAQLIETLVVIGNHDFPNSWPSLLPDLYSSLETGISANDFASVNCILSTLSSLFNFNSNPILLDLLHSELFAGDYNKLEQITQSIVIPNVMLTDEDEELFQKYYLEFIKRDMEGNDVNTRRKIACELLKCISGKNKEKITAQIYNCLTIFAENPVTNWKYKECAIYLVISLGGPDLIDIETFFKSFIVPELLGQQDVNTFPMLKASALKFFTIFRFIIPKNIAMSLLDDVVRYVASDIYAVHSYAAICIEKLLRMKDNNDVQQLQPRYTSSDIVDVHTDLVYNLFDALEYGPFVQQNQYTVRCLIRVFQMVDLSPVMVLHSIKYLTKALNRRNPKNLLFNHLLFETVSTLAKKACEKNPFLLTDFEYFIYNVFEIILCRKVTRSYPYEFQLLAQILDLNKPPIPLIYMEIFDRMLLRHDFWEKSANVAGLVRLLRSFFQQVPNEVNSEGRLRHVVGIINKLVSSPNTEKHGFHLLYTVIETYPYDVMEEYIKEIWVSMFSRLQNSKTQTLVRCVIVFMSLFLVKHGVQTLVDLIDVDLFEVILGEFWIPNLKTITGYIEVKLSAVASIKLLCESALLLDPAFEELWGKLLDAIVTLLSLPRHEERVDDDDDFDFDFDFDFGDDEEPTFVRLRNAGGKKEEDPLKEMEDPKQFLVGFPENISSEFHGKFPLVVMKFLSPENQAALVKLCNSYNVAIV